MINPNAAFVEQVKIVEGLFAAVPTGSTPDYVSLKGYGKCTAVISVKNATTVTGSAITMKQATTVAGGGEKALPFSRAWQNIDTAASDTLAEVAVTADTFTTDNTNSKNLLYVVEVRPDDMDVHGGFDCVRVGTGNATAATVHVTYLLWPCRYGGLGAKPSAILD